MLPFYQYQHRSKALLQHSKCGFKVLSDFLFFSSRERTGNKVFLALPTVYNCNESAEVKNRQLKAANNGDLHFDNPVAYVVNVENWALLWEAAHSAALLLPPAVRRLRVLLKAPTRRKTLAMHRISCP